MEQTNLSNAIITVINRFDLFDFPLTDFEIWQFLPIKASFNDVRNILPEIKNIETKFGFYFLSNRAEIVDIRQERYRDSAEKIKLVQRRIRLFSWLPWIRFISLANIIGPNNIKAQSDIDLFIVTKQNRVWMVKGLASFIFAILNLRPTKQKSKNTVCLSYLVDESALDLSNGLYNENDWYFNYWLVGLMPLYGSSQIYTNLFEANSWLTKMLPNWSLANSSPRKRFTEKKTSKLSFSFWNFFENLAHTFHMLVLAKALRQQANIGSSVIITDHVLKLHPGDRRDKLFNLELERLQNYEKIPS